MNFWILPVEVFGMGPNTTAFGVLKPGHLAAAKRDDLGFGRVRVVLQFDEGAGHFAPFRSGFATTAANSTAGCL